MFQFKLTPQQQRMKETLVFLVRLAVLSIPLYAILLFINLSPFQVLTAQHSALLLKGMGFEVLQEGALIQANDFRFVISPDSTAWKTMVFFGALVIAVPGIIWRRRLWGLAIGIPLLHVGNLARVVSIVLAEQAYGFEAAMQVHDLGWRFGLVGMVLVMWLVWMRFSKKSSISGKV